MLHEVFYWLFNMSIAAMIIGGVVILLRAIKKIPRRIFVFLWIAPFLRLCVPFGLDHPYSLMSLLSKITTKTIIVYRPTDSMHFSMTNFMMAANGYFPITYKVNILGDIFSVASIIWLIGFLIIAATLYILYFSALHSIKAAVHCKGNVYFSDKTSVPAVYGIFRPKIILPVSCKDNDIHFILLHENTHIKRGDNLWRVISFAVAAIHWYNPFVWIFLKLFLCDLELACDERVLSELQDHEIKEYAHSLLAFKEDSSTLVSSFGGAKIRNRIKNILSFKKLTLISLIGFVSLLIAIFSILLTNAA